MSKGENIFKRKDGRWEARYIKGRSPAGKARYGYCYGKTYREAKDKVTRAKADLLDGKTTPAPVRRILSSYCDEWLDLRKSEVKESTYVKYSTIVERHIKPSLGEYLPTDITATTIDGFARSLLLENALAPKTVRDILVVLKGVLNYTATFDRGMCVVSAASYPKCPRREMRVLSQQEQRCLIAYLMEDMDACKFGVLLALFTGLRIGELCALRWDCISAQDKTLRVAATLQRLRNTDASSPARTHIVTGTPKSGASARTIPLTNNLAVLCEHMRPPMSNAYVLTGTEACMEPRTLQYRMGKFTCACGLEGVHFHTLRHTFATRAVEAGFEIKSLSEVLGHSSTTVTLERYVHSSMELKRSNMDRLAAVGFGPAQSDSGVA